MLFIQLLISFFVITTGMILITCNMYGPNLIHIICTVLNAREKIHETHSNHRQRSTIENKCDTR